MANIEGQITVNEVDILEVSSDPGAGAGTPATVGSIALMQNDGAQLGDFFVKYGPLDTDWKTSGSNNFSGVGLYPLVFFHDANTGNKWLKYNEQHNERSDKRPYYAAFSFNVIGYSFMNKNTSLNSNLELYKNGTLLSNRVKTYSINNRYQYSMTDGEVLFNAGDRLSVYISKNSNPKSEDTTVILWCSAVDVASGSGSYNIPE